MSSTSPKTFLVCHGAWSAGWAWKKMHPLMHAAGHLLLTPTYTGLGERAHLANASIDLETHIQADPAAQLYLRHAQHAGGYLWSICQARQERARLALL